MGRYDQLRVMCIDFRIVEKLDEIDNQHGMQTSIEFIETQDISFIKSFFQQRTQEKETLGPLGFLSRRQLVFLLGAIRLDRKSVV